MARPLEIRRKQIASQKSAPNADESMFVFFRLIGRKRVKKNTLRRKKKKKNLQHHLRMEIGRFRGVFGVSQPCSSPVEQSVPGAGTFWTTTPAWTPV